MDVCVESDQTRFSTHYRPRERERKSSVGLSDCFFNCVVTDEWFWVSLCLTLIHVRTLNGLRTDSQDLSTKRLDCDVNATINLVPASLLF